MKTTETNFFDLKVNTGITGIYLRDNNIGNEVLQEIESIIDKNKGETE